MHRLVRLALGLALALALLPVAAGAQTAADPSVAAAVQDERRERRRGCSVLRKQIAHFETVRERARERDDDLWQRSTETHLGRLRNSQLRRCPDDVPPDLAEKVGDLLAKLGKLALTAATIGAL